MQARKNCCELDIEYDRVFFHRIIIHPPCNQKRIPHLNAGLTSLPKTSDGIKVKLKYFFDEHDSPLHESSNTRRSIQLQHRQMRICIHNHCCPRGGFIPVPFAVEFIPGGAIWEPAVILITCMHICKRPYKCASGNYKGRKQNRSPFFEPV